MKTATKKKPKLTDNHLIGKTAGEVLHHFNSHRAADNQLSVDRLLTNPVTAIDLCKETNVRLNRQLKYEQILKELLNARKRGDLKN